MEERRDLESVLPLLPLILRSSSLCWPPPSLHALKALSLGPTISDVASGHVLFDAIVDLRFHLGFSRDRLASSVGDGYVLFFDKLISSIDSRKVARGIHPCLGQLAAASAVSFRGSLSRRRCQFFSSNSSSLVVIARSRVSVS